ncbi:MAG: hypothetical protein DMD80_13940 [Candidatus Rokuibacteriota bacterium]|nr:MAG: hypothetical protein DMD80_13940 [Candidatus Rokubacteria bacterium]
MTTTSGQMTTASEASEGQTTTKLADLERRRRALALDAREGKRGAARELEEIESAIAALERDEERQELADRERVDRDAAAAAKQAEDRRRELQRQLAELLPRREAAARAVERAAEDLVAACNALALVGKNMFRISHDLGRPRARLNLDVQIAGYLQWRLGAVCDLPRPDRTYRRPLVEVVGGERQVKS